MSTPKVLIADKLSPQAIDVFKQRGVEADVKTGLTPEELLAIAANYDGIAVRSATKITKDVLAAAKKLKVVGRAGIGVDNVDVPAATAAGVGHTHRNHVAPRPQQPRRHQGGNQQSKHGVKGISSLQTWEQIIKNGKKIIWLVVFLRPGQPRVFLRNSKNL